MRKISTENQVTIRGDIAAIIEREAFEVYSPKDHVTRIQRALRVADAILARLAMRVATTGEQPSE